jgi:hypothetical protein
MNPMRLRGLKREAFRICAIFFSAASFWAWLPHALAISVRCDRLFEEIGPKVRLELPGVKRDTGGQQLKRLKIGHYSLNTFDLINRRKPQIEYQNKDAAIAAIEFERPDVLTLSEVKNQETLTEISRRLNGLYEAIMIEGNSDVSLAVLVRKSLPLVVEVESHRSVRHEYMGNRVPLFTRDLLVIHLSLPGEDQALISLAAGHFKARKNNFVRDPFFTIKRGAEERGALEILEESSRLRSSRARILLGDMNSDVRRSTEMTDFKAAGYRDALDVLGIPPERRASHSLFPRIGDPAFWQTDAAFLSSEIVHRNALVSGYIAPDRSLLGRALPRPRTIEELRTRGSDHKMYLIEIDITKLR